MLSANLLLRSLAPVLVLLAGCAAAPPDSSSADVRENGVLVLTRADHERTVELRVGERMEVRLPENPATGYRWSVDEHDRHRLTLEDTAYTPPDTASSIGARGQRRFSLIARQPGDALLKMKYGRVWEGDGSVTDRFTAIFRIGR